MAVLLDIQWDNLVDISCPINLKLRLTVDSYRFSCLDIDADIKADISSYTPLASLSGRYEGGKSTCLDDAR